MYIKKLVLLVFMLLPSISAAAGVAVGKIKGYVFTEAGIYVSSEAAISNKAACNVTSRFYFAYGSAYDDAFIAAILSAFVSEQTVSLNGTGDCGGGNSELLRKICTPGVPC